MFPHRQRFPGLAMLALLISVCWGLLLWLIPMQPAVASIHTHHEQPGQTTLRSRQSLRDQNNLAWQATLFKRYREGTDAALYLRLVGFPGQVTIDAKTDLQIETGTMIEWSAPPEFDPQAKSLPENVAQYRVDDMLQDLQTPIPLTLVVPLQQSNPARLVVAPFIVQEWLQLNQMLPEL